LILINERYKQFDMDALRSQFRINQTDTGSHRFRNWLLSFALVGIFVICCYFWIDRPIAFWVYAHQNHLANRDDLDLIASVPNPLLLLAAVLFFLLGFSRLANRPLKQLQQVMLVSSTSVLVGEVIKELLKWIFGRPSPDLWATANVSAAGDYEYHFHWFHGVEPFNSFPSGHMTAATAVLAVLWMCYPQFRPIYVACCGLVAAGLVAFNFHFFGDVIAGGMLGSTIGLLVLTLFEGSIMSGVKLR